MTPETLTPPRWKVVLAFAAVYLIWGSTYLAIRFAIETMPPLFMAGVRFTVSGLILYAWSRLRGAPGPDRHHWAAAAVIGALLLLGGNGGVVLAEQRVPSGLAAVLVAVVPVWMVVLQWLRPGGGRPTLRVMTGLALGLAGLVVLVSPASLGLGERVDALGAVMLVLASLSWAIGSLYSRAARLPSSPLLSTGMEMLAGGAALVLAGLLLGEGRGLDLAAITPRSALALLYLIVFGALIGFTAYLWLLRVAPPTQVSTYAYVNPVVAVLLGWLLAGESLSLRTAFATLAIVASVLLITRGTPRPAAAGPRRAV